MHTPLRVLWFLNKDVDVAAVIAALSNNSVPLSIKGGAAPKAVPTRPSVALGESDIHNIPHSSEPRATNTPFSFAAPAVDIDILAQSLRFQKTSSEFLFVRTATDEYVNELGASSNQFGKLSESLFPVKHGGGPILEDWLRNALDLIAGSPRLELLLHSTEFLRDPTGILKGVLLNEWLGSGYLASSTTAYKADIAKFLKASESPDSASDILSAACRLIQVQTPAYCSSP